MMDFFIAAKTIRLLQENLLEDLKEKYIGKKCYFMEFGENVVFGIIQDIDIVNDIIEITASLLEGHSYKPSGFIVYLNALEVEIHE